MRTPPVYLRTPRRLLTQTLADALVAGPWREDDLAARAAETVGRRARWIRPLVRRVLARFDEGSRPTSGRVAAFLTDDIGLARACARRPIDLAAGIPAAPVMWPAPGAPAGWDVPPITTPAALADWLEVPLDLLDGLADVQGRHRLTPPGKLRHYDYRWVPKRDGRARLIEAPRSRLKAVQRRVLDTVIAAVPPHDAAHGFRPGRSVRTFAAPHAGREVVIKLDLRDFFPSVTGARVVAIFLTAGYPEAVARRLAGLCTARTPRDVWSLPDAPGDGPDTWLPRKRLELPHLPQGAPTSPALANLAAFHLDARLTGLAAALNATYTRYADDLVFSGGPELARVARRFVVSVMATALEEGFTVQPRKTRIMNQGVRQRVAGVVVNAHPNSPRDAFDRLKATLHNCVRTGPAGQNRENHPDFRAHLAGRVAHVAHLNPARGAKLKALLDAVRWDAG